MKKTTLSFFGLSLAAFSLLSQARAQTLFSENFDVDPSANWTVTQGGGTDSFADFNFDYGTVLGIPAAPNSTNGTTRGLRFLVNQSAGVQQGVNASPNGQSFTGNYRLRFDMWLNTVGPFPAGGNGSTQMGSFGVGVTAGNAQWAGSNPNGILFSTTAEGGAAQDYRCYSNSVFQTPASGVYAAGTGTSPDARNDLNPYYAGLGSKTAPASQLALFPGQTGTTTTGSAGFAWRDVVVEKVDNIVTWKLDGRLIATCQTTETFADNIFFGMFDINATSSTDANDFLIASIFDNVRVEALSSAVSVSASVPDSAEGGSPGMFTFSRAGDTGFPLTVNFVLSGTASNGVDYTNLAASITFATGETATNLAVETIDDTLAEPAETVILTITPSTNYSVGAASATVSIADNETPELSIIAVSPSLYERIADDYATFRLARRGDLSSTLTANVVYSGTADGSRYSGPPTVNIDAGAATTTFTVSPLNDGLLNSNQTIIATIAAGTGYAVGATNSASTTIIDDEWAAETILFADSLAEDTSSLWTTNFAANNQIDDYFVGFAYDVSLDGISVPPNGSNMVLKLTVNKSEPTAAGAAGINLYPVGQSFSGDYAVRFNMYLAQNSSLGTTEFALMGLHHSGTKTNWLRQTGAGPNQPLDCDGLWFAVISDASGVLPGDYTLFTSTNAANAPALLASAAATGFTQAFKKPPYSPNAPGVPANLPSTATPTWADVEVKKIGSVVTLSINKTQILQFTNNTAFTSGNIMLGYTDPYESIGSTGGAVYYSNLRVVNLSTAPPIAPTITNLMVASGMVMFDFNGGTSDTPSSFTIESTATLGAAFTTDTAATAGISAAGPGMFHVMFNANGATRFYRIRR